jgi:hypothetical protein
MDKAEFEAELRRDGFRPVFASLRPNMKETNHCHDFDARLLVLGGEITITRDNITETFRAGQCCEVPAGCMHTEQVGHEGVAYLSGRRRNGGPITREAFESDLRAARASRLFMEVRSPTSPKISMRTAGSTCASWC